MRTRQWLLLAVGASLIALGWSSDPVQAGSRVVVGIGVPGPYYYRPYYRPCYYAPPPPFYYGPRPVYVYPAPPAPVVYVTPPPGAYPAPAPVGAPPAATPLASQQTIPPPPPGGAVYQAPIAPAAYPPR